MKPDRQQTIRALFDEYIGMYATRDDRLTRRFSKNFTGLTGSWERLVQDQAEWVGISRQDFEQVPGPIRIDVIDTSLQDLSEDVVSVAATLHIHLPNEASVLASQVTRLFLVFRQEDGVWMITHCSYSVPYHRTTLDEVYPLKSVMEENRTLQALVAERTRSLRESQAFYRMLAEDAEDVHWQMDCDLVMTYVSPADERLRGFRADEVVGHSVFELLTEEAGAQLRKVLNPSDPNDLLTGRTGLAQCRIVTLPLFCGVLNPRFTRLFCAVPRTSDFRIASG